MNIAFITTHIKTHVFHGVATRLEKSGHKAFWLSPSHTWAQWLEDEGVRPERILDIERFGPEWAAAPELTGDDLAELNRLEEAGGWTLKSLILMDRLLSRKPYAYALAYLWVSQREIRRFLVENEVEALFIESTWAFELVAVQVCRLLGIPVYTPQTPRFPDGHFVFFDGQLESRFERIRPTEEADRTKARELLAEFRARKPRPGYFQRNNVSPTFKTAWVGKLLYHRKFARTDRYNETRFPIPFMVTRRLAEVANTRAMRLFRFFETPSLPPKRPFVLMTLHKQPESSIDVLGPSTSNQLELIGAVARCLPASHDLYVKEHSNAIGDRSPFFYRDAKRIPGVVLVDPYLNSFDLMAHASLVVTVSGTVAYEAGLLGVPAITLAPMFFSSLMAIDDPSMLANYSSAIQKFLLTPQAPENDERRIELLADIVANACPGTISDPESDPTCVDPENLDRLAQGFERLLAVLSERGGKRATA